MALVIADQIHKSFGDVKVLRGINLRFEQGSQYALCGTSGSGKSTLLYLLGGLDRPSSGQVIIDKTNLAKLSDDQLALYRNQRVGFVFQFHFLLPSIDCFENILLPAKIGNSSLDQVRKDVLALADRLGVAHCLKKFPYQISGGEQQRINIIRALSLRPQLLLCDEPTGNLDSKNSQIVTQVLKDLSQQFGATLIVVTHNERVASSFSQKITIEDGQIIR